MDTIKISVIVGSTRQGRFSEKPAAWIAEIARQQPGVEVEVLDLREYPLPFFDEPMGPSMLNGNYSTEIARKWAAKVGEADAYVIVTPEYNHGTSAVLKNALDYVFPEWNNKPVGFVSYGTVGGARAVEQLRLTCIELSMAPIRNAVHIPGHILFPIIMGKAQWDDQTKAGLKENGEKLITQLLWWAKALKTARAQG